MSTKLSQDVSIGENLRILRKRAGYSQERAAAQLELMGISMSREIISQMESGHHNIRISVLLAFKQVYEVDSFDDFFVQQEKVQLINVNSKMRKNLFYFLTKKGRTFPLVKISFFERY